MTMCVLTQLEGARRVLELAGVHDRLAIWRSSGRLFDAGDEAWMRERADWPIATASGPVTVT